MLLRFQHHAPKSPPTIWPYTEPCEIWDFHNVEDSSRGFLGSDPLQYCGRIPAFRRTLLPPSSGWNDWDLKVVIYIYIYSAVWKFVDTHYSESEFCNGAVTVSFSKYLPRQAMHFYNAPPNSRKRAADFRLPRFFFFFFFLPPRSLLMVWKAQKLHGARSGLSGGCYYGVPPIHFFPA
jgi:hypothetical protein